jgi:hypothetical protein
VHVEAELAPERIDAALLDAAFGGPEQADSDIVVCIPPPLDGPRGSI